MAFPNIVFGSPGDQFSIATAAEGNRSGGPLGTQLVLADGRKFRYAEKDSAAATAARMQSCRAVAGAHVLQTAAAAAVGATSVALTLGATAAAENLFEDGLLTVDLATNTGAGYSYGIGKHAAVATSGVFTVPLKEPVQVAISTAANSVSVITNKYKAVVIAPTTEIGTLAGVAVKPIAAAGFGWLQTRGETVILGSGTLVIGEPVSALGAAGAAGPLAVVTTVPIGVCRRVATTTDFSTVDLWIDG